MHSPKANYGIVAPLSASSAAVPEPTTYALALAALCLAMSRRRSF
ncbi:MAG: PEP-CTERM sorting domain-containing protein [Planctomycetes bacterium]|nr:PEP-CTERM sorting domain-containing protein [Planctomycetota bacterium]